MKRIDMISRPDWEQIAAGMKASHNAVLDMYSMLAIVLGKNHSVTKQFLTIYRKNVRLQSDLRRMAQEHGRHVFEEKELDRLFPDADTGELSKKGWL